MVESLLQVTFWKACNKQNTWECWMCTGCYQQRLATDSVRTRSWSGDSKNYCVWDFDSGSWYEMCCDKIHSAASATREKEHHAAVRRTVWGFKISTLKGTELLSYAQCFFYHVSASVNVSIFLITWLDTICTYFIYIFIIYNICLYTYKHHLSM